MERYYVNKEAQETGEHEVHKDGCPHPAVYSNREYLGEYYSCEAAVEAAKAFYSNVDGCYYCCRPCHTR